MYLWLLSNSDITHHLVVGRGLRAEAMSRAAYGAITGIEDLAARATGTAAGVLRAASAALARWRRRRQAIAELGALNDHMLNDIGIDRSEIASAVTESLLAESHAHEGKAPAAEGVPLERIRARGKRPARSANDNRSAGAKPARLVVCG